MSCRRWCMVSCEIELLNAKRACLMVIDPQERLMKAIHEAERVVEKTAFLVRSCQILNVPILATTQYAKGIGPIVPQLAELLADTPSVDKMEFNAAYNSDVMNALAKMPSSVDTLILAGVEAHICIYQTAIGMMTKGYGVYVAMDAVSSREKRNAKAALRQLQAFGVVVAPAETIVYEMLGRAGTPEFKAILPYVK